MKQIVIVCLIAILASCTSNSQNEKSKEESIQQENIALVEKYIKAVQDKDVKAMSDMLADNYIGYGPSFNDSIDKAGAVASWTNLSQNFYEKIEYRKSINVAATVNDAYHPGNFVSNFAHLVIKFKDGKGPIEIFANTSYRIENGKITLSRTIYNEADALRQLGYKIVAPEQATN